MTKPELTMEAFDRMTTSKPARIIWTLPAIGQRIGVGADFVRDVVAKQPGSPIRQLGGKWYAFEDDLSDFLRADHAKPA